MITVFGEGRGFSRRLAKLEEMGLSIPGGGVWICWPASRTTRNSWPSNPGGFIPAIQDGDVTMVESIATGGEYLMARYGPTPLAPVPHDPAFPAYQQFLHLGEAGLAAASIYFVSGLPAISRPRPSGRNWSAGQALDVFETRLGLITRQLALLPYLAGDAFTAADISVTYALELAQRTVGFPLAPAEQAYVARTTARDGYKRAMAACVDTKAWVARIAAGNVTAPRVGDGWNEPGLGGPKRTRTSDLRFRKPLLCPAELSGRDARVHSRFVRGMRRALRKTPARARF